MGTTSLFRGYSFAPHRNIDFAIHLCEGLGYCTLCKFLGRPRSNYDYIHCPVCAKERKEYENNKSLQDFLYGDTPKSVRGYGTEIHGRIRIVEALTADGQISEDEALAIFTDFAVGLQPKLRNTRDEARENRQQKPSEKLKQIQDYRFFS